MVSEFTSTTTLSPNALGGPDTPENQVVLTIREHIICHHMLCYMFEQGCSASNKCWYAYKRAINRHGTKISARRYEFLKKACATRMSMERTGVKRKPKTQAMKDHMSQIMKGRKKTLEHIENHRKALRGKPCHPMTLAASCRVTYEVTYPNGSIETFSNLNRWCTEHPGMSRNSILGYFARNWSHYKGHKFRKL